MECRPGVTPLCYFDTDQASTDETNPQSALRGFLLSFAGGRVLALGLAQGFPEVLGPGEELDHLGFGKAGKVLPLVDGLLVGWTL